MVKDKENIQTVRNPSIREKDNLIEDEQKRIAELLEELRILNEERQHFISQYSKEYRRSALFFMLSGIPIGFLLGIILISIIT